MEHRKVRVCLANRADRLVKTAAVKRRSYVYRFFGKETENGMTRDFVEEIEIRAGEDGVTAENIKELYSAEDAEIYRNLKECRKTYDAEERRRVSEWTENYVSAFRAKYGYDPQPMDLKETVEERFPRTRNVPLNDILNTEDIENQRFFDDEPGFLEAADELARAWPASWRKSMSGCSGTAKAFPSLRGSAG